MAERRRKSRKFSEHLLLGVGLPRFAREQLLRDRKRWRKQLDHDLEWIPPLSLHLTLRYLGELERGRSKSLCQRLETLSQHSGSFLVELVPEIEAVPDRRQAKLLSMKVAVSNELLELVAGIESCCQQSKVEKDKKPFQPHITLARSSEPFQAPPLKLDESLKGFTVKGFSLVESRLGRSGTTFHPLSKFALKRPPGGLDA